MKSEPQRNIKIKKVMWAGHKECLKGKRTKEDVVLFVLFLGILSVVGIVLVPLYCYHNSNCTKIGVSSCLSSMEKKEVCKSKISVLGLK